MSKLHHNKVTIYSKNYCPYCKAAKQILLARGLDYTEVDVQVEPEKLAEMFTRSGRHTVPQIFFGDTHIGGHDDLVHYYSAKAG